MRAAPRAETRAAQALFGGIAQAAFGAAAVGGEPIGQRIAAKKIAVTGLGAGFGGGGLGVGEQAEQGGAQGGIGGQQRLADTDDVVHRIGARVHIPARRLGLGIRDHRTRQRRIEAGQRDAGVDLSRQQHGGEILAGSDPRHVGRVGILGDMGVLGGDPGDGAVVDVVLLTQDAAQPEAGGL